MIQTTQNTKRESRQYSVSLFPEHDRIIRQFAAESHRNYSNAVQYIIEEWERMRQAAAPIPQEQPA